MSAHPAAEGLRSLARVGREEIQDAPTDALQGLRTIASMETETRTPMTDSQSKGSARERAHRILDVLIDEPALTPEAVSDTLLIFAAAIRETRATDTDQKEG